GDDQYENFREECVPAFCVLALDDIKVQPWLHPFMGIPNVWGEDEGTTVDVPGAREVGRHVARGLLDAGFDTAYAYQTRADQPFPHAFLNTLLFLDYDRAGFDVPILPIAVNCYGRHLVTRKGGLARFKDAVPPEEGDPPSPSPRRCSAMGAAVARILRDSPWRAVLVASSSWSHAFLTDKTWRLWPDTAADRRLYEALAAGDFAVWRDTPLAAIEESGQQEMLNWFCLAGAVEELGMSLEWSEFVETWVFNSNKCFALLRLRSDGGDGGPRHEPIHQRHLFRPAGRGRSRPGPVQGSPVGDDVGGDPATGTGRHLQPVLALPRPRVGAPRAGQLQDPHGRRPPADLRPRRRRQGAG